VKERHDSPLNKSADELAQEMGINLDIKSPDKQSESVQENSKEEKVKEKFKQKLEENKPEEKEPPLVSMTQEEWNGVKAQMAKVLNDYKELEKDFENFRVRCKDSVVVAKQEGLIQAVLALAPALDSFKKAKQMTLDKTLLGGIELIEKSILSSLEKLHVNKIDAVGKMFDPQLHNAVLLQEGTGQPSGIVASELESGYTLDGKVIKYSQVVVAK